jgi:uncharacterized protein (DUF2252 family)
MNTIFERIQQFNQGRDPKLFELKSHTMQSDAFAFFRGTCHLFYEDWPTDTTLNEAPPVWISGDLHLENFGSYKADNRLVYFDINDFDEAVLAPCTWDVARFLTSVLVAAHSLNINKPEAIALCHCFLDIYISTLLKGQARTVERETAVGLVKDLLMSLKFRARQAFLDERTKQTNGKRKLRIDRKHTQAVSSSERAKVTQFLNNWATQQPNPKFFRLLDIAHRIAGTGSLGIERYVLLVEGNGSPHQNYLLDLKAEPKSSLEPYLQLPQPQWLSEAHRAVAIQTRVQGTPPALLAAVEIDGQAYVLRELQPSQDRVNLSQWNGKIRRLEKVMKTMGAIVAWGQLRSAGRQGSAIADELIEFAQACEWRQVLLEYAQAYSVQVETDYQAFCVAAVG